MLLGMFIRAAILCGIMHVVARHEADYSFPKVALISLGVSIVGMLVAVPLGLLALPVILVVLTVALTQFCYLGWGKALLVSTLYLGIQLVVAFLLVPGSEA